MSRYVIIGASIAGIEAAKELRRIDRDSDIVVISIDKEIGSRCMIHKFLAGERSRESLNFIDTDFFETSNIVWMAGKTVVKIKEFEQQVILSDGNEINYDKLLIASGADYYIPPIPNLREGSNVFGFRSVQDVDKIKKALVSYGARVVIIGGGLVGMDVAYALCELGKDVTLVEMAERIMPLQTDEYVSCVYKQLFEEHGCKMITGTSVTETIFNPETGLITEVVLSGEERLACDFIVVAASVKPKIDFLQGTSIQAVHMNYHINTILNKYLRRTNFSVNKGMEVDEYMQTTSKNIYAAGDVTGKSAIWPDASLMGKYAARNMCGLNEACVELNPYKNTSNFWGVTMLSLGKLDVMKETNKIMVHYDGKNYKKVVIHDGIMVGALFLGNLTDAGVYQYIIQKKIDITHLEDKIFRLTFADFYDIDKKDGQYVYLVS